MNTRSPLFTAMTVLCVGSAAVRAQDDSAAAPQVRAVPAEAPPDAIVRLAANVVPSARQWRWQKTELIGFLHFGMNTFTGQEWGDGTANPSLFHPTALDARQWVRGAKAAGMRMLILTAKHHDGFCLWPSAFTSYSVRSSPWKGGRGDVVRELSDACRAGGMKFGFYLSPWDRHDPSYGSGERYNEHFRNQLRELLTGYGEISEVWFDGANGEGPDGRKQSYDWNSYYRMIRDLQPGAVIAIMGPDVRWVGTETGVGRETEWSVLPAPDSGFVPRDLTAEDLGSRGRIAHARALFWYPAETDVSIRPGWFYHAEEDAHVKTAENLVDIYFSSVGRNGVLILNIPPDKRGRIPETDIRSLTGMRAILDRTFGRNLLRGAPASASSESPAHPASGMLDGSDDTYWTAAHGADTATIRFALTGSGTFDRAMLQEYVRTGQRIEHFHLDAWDGNSWMSFASGTTVGYKRLLRFPPVTASAVRLVIDSARSSPTLSEFGLFNSPADSRK